MLSRQVGDLQADNLKLYEKIRFLQVIGEGNLEESKTQKFETSLKKSFHRPVVGLAGEARLWFQLRTGMALSPNIWKNMDRGD